MRNRIRETAAVLLGFLGLAILITWPLLTNFTTEITGQGLGGDQSGYVWDLWFLSENGLSLWGGLNQEEVSAPFGRESAASINTTLLATLLPGWITASIWSPIAAYNVVLLLALTLNGGAMYALGRWIGFGIGPAVWSGVAFVLFPYSIARAGAHLTLVPIFCFPILLWAAWRWIERPSFPRALALTGAYALAWLSNPYYGVMASVILLVLGVWGVVAAGWGWRIARSARVATTLSASVIGLVLVPLALLFASGKSAVENTLTRPEIDLLIYGARVSDYVLPIRAGTWYEIFGESLSFAPGGERLNFVGYGTLALALGAVIILVAPGLLGRLEDRHRLVVLSGLVLLPVLVWFSLATPTEWFGQRIPTPASAIFDAAPFLRVYARFVVPIMAILLAMSVVSLGMVIRWRPSDVWRKAVLFGALLFVAIELPPGLPVPTSEPLRVAGVHPRDVETWNRIAELPEEDIVYEFPGGPDELIERFYMYGQLFHGHRIANGSLVPGQVGWDFTAVNPDPRLTGVARRLAGLGIDSVTVNPWAYARLQVPPPDPRDPPPGFTVDEVYEDGSAVWHITARPADAVAFQRSTGWWNVEQADGRVFRWMHTAGDITVFADRPGRYVARFSAKGLKKGARPYTAEISHGSGAAQTITVPERGGVYEVPLTLKQGLTDITIRRTGGPAPKRISAADPRVVSIAVSDWDVRRAD